MSGSPIVLFCRLKIARAHPGIDDAGIGPLVTVVNALSLEMSHCAGYRAIFSLCRSNGINLAAAGK
jgi:hypothetical protein